MYLRSLPRHIRGTILRVNQLIQEPVVQRTVNFKFQRTDRMRNTFQIIALTMREIIHRVNTPFIPGSVMSHVHNTVHDRVTHQHIRRCHIYFCPQNFLSFLGIKIHRAILQISWELTSEYTSTSVVEVMTLDPNKSDKEKADEVNKRISEIAQEYPSCKITTEYAKSAPTENDGTPDTYHLLWQSDRLEIARQVDSRITKIYADLVSLEKMMHYKRSIIDVLKSVAPHINDDQGRRLTLVEECRKRWLRKAANSNRVIFQRKPALCFARIAKAILGGITPRCEVKYHPVG